MLTRENVFYLQKRRTYVEYLFKAVFTQPMKTQIDQMARYIVPGSCVIDIGANAGFFAHRFSKYIGDGVALAFEPQSVPRSIMTVASFFKRNRNIVLFPMALGQATGLLKLKIPFKSRHKVGISLAHTGDHDDLHERFEVRHELVPCWRLDDVMKEVDFGPVSMIKIDVEGGELDVLRGARNTIAAHRPTVICEIDGRDNRFGTTRRELLDYFRALGYAAHSLDTGLVLPDGETERNTVFRPVMNDPGAEK